MLNKIIVVDDQGRNLSLPLTAYSGAFFVKEIRGLDPGKDHPNSRMREQRNVVLKMGYRPYGSVHTVEYLRQILYSFFLPKKNVTFWFYKGSSVAYARIGGVVESFDSPLFKQNPDASISIMCKDPDFYGAYQQTVSGRTIKTIDDAPKYLRYTGTKETGFQFRLTVDRSIPGFDVYIKKAGRYSEKISVRYDFVAGDVVIIGTVAGYRGITLTRDDETFPIVGAVSTDSRWPQFGLIDNYVYAVVDDEGLPMNWAMTYYNRFGGL